MSGCDDPTKKDGFCVPDAALLRNSLGQKLIPVVDRVRDVLTCLGLRPYRVKIVRCRFAGGRRGQGPEQVVHELELLPTPKVVDMSALTEVDTPLGINEQGLVQLQKISGRYTEETLIGVGPDGNQVAPNETVYYEIEFFRRDGRPSEKRRFVRETVPTWNAATIEWTVTLNSVIEKRGRDGQPRG